MTTGISLSYEADVCRLTMEPPAGKPPTLDYDVIGRFEAALDEITAKAGTLVAVVLQSASPKFFCAGANLNVMQTMDVASIAPWVERGHRLMNRIEALPLPVIARVDGYAMGGGLELAMACDLIYATSGARFAQSEGKLGLVTGWGGCYRLERRIGLARAKELIFTGRLLDAAEAVRLGVADWQGEPAALDAHLREVLGQIAGTSRVSIREMKALLHTCRGSTLAENLALETEASRRVLADGDTQARLAHFFASRKSR